jgi:hypothetical protein
VTWFDYLFEECLILVSRFFMWFVLCFIYKFICMVENKYLQALVRNATDAMQESRVLDVISVVRHIC